MRPHPALSHCRLWKPPSSSPSRQAGLGARMAGHARSRGRSCWQAQPSHRLLSAEPWEARERLWQDSDVAPTPLTRITLGTRGLSPAMTQLCVTGGRPQGRFTGSHGLIHWPLSNVETNGIVLQARNKSVWPSFRKLYRSTMQQKQTLKSSSPPTVRPRLDQT